MLQTTQAGKALSTLQKRIQAQNYLRRKENLRIIQAERDLRGSPVQLLAHCGAHYNIRPSLSGPSKTYIEKKDSVYKDTHKILLCKYKLKHVWLNKNV